jgi:Nucleotidyl transferase AbiEii toxin, Type IV TA system
VFDAKSVAATRIKEGAEYEGVRVAVRGKLGSARLGLQIDIGFGDAITPAPAMTEFSTLLDLPSPKVRAYPRETVVAEKLHAIVYLGMANSRMKDFFDLWFLCREFQFEGPALTRAIQATFERRSTALPGDTPTGLTESFALDGNKQTQWKAFLRRSQVTSPDHSLSDVIDTITPFLLPALEAARADSPLSSWPPGGPWS